MSEASDTVALVVSELITNSVAASRALEGGPYPVLLRLLSDRSEILIMVHDASPGQPGRMNPAEDAEGGRGLMLVEAVSKRWDWYAVSKGESRLGVVRGAQLERHGLAGGNMAHAFVVRVTPPGWMPEALAYPAASP
jgi:anti-sigma regulatory factor (Ser/Thr protein kinase)